MVHASFIADTGVDLTVITKEEATRLEGVVSLTRRVFTATDGSVLNILGRHKVKLTSTWGQSEEEAACVLEGLRITS